MAEREWEGTGVAQEVTPHRLQLAASRMDDAMAYAVKSETHLWVILMTHRATDATLDVIDGKDGQPLLDADTLLSKPNVGCYVCEQAYAPSLRRRRCPGEPR